jgi:predicted transcriptional regulator
MEGKYMNLNLRIDESLRARLDKMAKDLDRPLSWVGVEALEQYLSHNEEFVAAEKRAVAAADSGGPFVSHDEVVAESEARIKARGV